MSDNIEVEAHLGLRYGRAARFEPSEAAEGRFGGSTLAELPLFPQLPGRLEAAMGAEHAQHPQTEDAFAVNVWAPQGASGLPVVVFLHGGAWATGGGTSAWYDGTAVAQHGIVVVTLNYRVGPLAHLAPTEASDPTALVVGDLMQGLRWVQRNIGAFGGDRARVTLAGQSAGAWYAHLLNLHPEAAGLFDRVALWSMTERTPWPREKLHALSAHVREAVGDLRRAPVEALLSAGQAALRTQCFAFGELPSGYLPTESPVVPAAFLDADACAPALHSSSLLLRTTAHEAGAFFFAAPERGITTEQWRAIADAEDLGPRVAAAAEPYAALVAQRTWTGFDRFTDALADAAAQAGTRVTRTSFDLSSPLPGFGSGHTYDLPFQFGTRAAWRDAPMLAHVTDDVFAATSDELIRELVDFVTYPEEEER